MQWGNLRKKSTKQCAISLRMLLEDTIGKSSTATYFLDLSSKMAGTKGRVPDSFNSACHISVAIRAFQTCECHKGRQIHRIKICKAGGVGIDKQRVLGFLGVHIQMALASLIGASYFLSSLLRKNETHSTAILFKQFSTCCWATVWKHGTTNNERKKGIKLRARWYAQNLSSVQCGCSLLE